MLTVRMLTGAPFAIRVPKPTAKTFLGKGIVATFDPPTIATTPEVKRQEFAVYTNVPEALWAEYIACESDEDRAKINLGTPSHASSPVAVTEREFDSWITANGDRMTASRLLARGVVAFEPKRAGKTNEADVLSAIDSVFALLGRDVPAEDATEASEDESSEPTEDAQDAPAPVPASKPAK